MHPCFLASPQRCTNPRRPGCVAATCAETSATEARTHSITTDAEIQYMPTHTCVLLIWIRRWEILHHHYSDRLGISLPHVSALLPKMRPLGCWDQVNTIERQIHHSLWIWLKRYEAEHVFGSICLPMCRVVGRHSRTVELSMYLFESVTWDCSRTYSGAITRAYCMDLLWPKVSCTTY